MDKQGVDTANEGCLIDNSGYLGTIIGYLAQPGIQPSSAKSELLLATCFVIQPFDGGKFDKRFDDILVPAIRDAGLEAYRVDRDPTVSIPIEQIESGIESCRAHLNRQSKRLVRIRLRYR